MGGTRDGFFHHKNKNKIITTSSPIKEEKKTKIEINKLEEQKGVEINNIINKPLIIESDKKKENDKNEINIVKEIYRIN